MASKKKTLFIVGAGCSKNYDCSNNGIVGLASPTNKDFFIMARKVLLNSDISSNSTEPLTELFQQICAKRGLQYDDDYRFLEDPALTNLEDIMTSIDIDSALFEPRLTVQDEKHPYNVLVELITFTINRALVGPACEQHRKLARIIDETDTILNFNYDLLLDHALRDEKKLDDFGYHVNFFEVRKNGGWQKPESKRQGIVDLFKLHGSFNWLRCAECSGIFLLRDFKISEKLFDIGSLRELECPRCSSQGYLTRLLLPPIQTKEYHVEPYRFLWSQAARKLREIYRIAFLGYSLALTDFATRSLLRQILCHTSMKGLAVHFMNKSSEPEERFVGMFPKIQTPTRTTNLQEFLKFYPSWS